MRAPFSLTIAAHINVRALPGHVVQVPLAVANTGRHALTVIAGVLRPAAGWQLALSRPRFTIRPGHHTVEWLRLVIPAGARGTHDLHVVFAALPLSHSAGVRVAGGVADTIQVMLPAAPVAHQPGGWAWPLAAGAGLFVMFVALAVYGAWRRRRLGRAQARVQQPRRERAGQR